MNLCVFASGKGSNLEAILNANRTGIIRSEVRLIVSNNSASGALQIAKSNNIPGLHISALVFPDENNYVNELITHLDKYKIELIVLAGYMKLIPSKVIKKFKNRIINIHPALIPSFCGHGLYGMKVHESVIEYGAKVSGATVHLVDEVYDNGPIILQRCIEVIDKDTPESLQRKVLEIEHNILPEAIKLFESKKFNINGRRVYFT